MRRSRLLLPACLVSTALWIAGCASPSNAPAPEEGGAPVTSSPVKAPAPTPTPESTATPTPPPTPESTTPSATTPSTPTIPPTVKSTPAAAPARTPPPTSPPPAGAKWVPLAFGTTNVDLADGKHVITVTAKAPSAGWKVELRPRKAEDPRYQEYDLVGLAPASAAGAPEEVEVKREEAFGARVFAVVINGKDGLSAIEEVPKPEPEEEEEDSSSSDE